MAYRRVLSFADSDYRVTRTVTVSAETSAELGIVSARCGDRRPGESYIFTKTWEVHSNTLPVPEGGPCRGERAMSDAVVMTDEEKLRVAQALSDTETKAICASVGYLFDPDDEIRSETQSAGAKVAKDEYTMTVPHNEPVMREARIILPITEWQPTNHAYLGEQWLENALTQAFGGFIRQRGVGGGLDPEGHNMIENVYIYDVAMLDTVSSWQDLRLIAQQLALITDQQCIYVRSPAGVVFFVGKGERDMESKFEFISTFDLFAVLSRYESAHEPDQREYAKAALRTWGVTYDEAIREYKVREKGE